MEITTHSASHTQKVGEEIGHYLKEKGNGSTARILFLKGELGSGKTTFVGGLAKAFDVPDRMLSPTYTLIREYAIQSNFSRLMHVDLYRMGKTDGDEVGLAEIIADPSTLIIIEWPERLTLRAKADITITFEHISETARKIVVTDLAEIIETKKSEQAIEKLQKGGIAVFPTDTAFGIGCRIDKPESIQKLFSIRRRPEDKATPVLVSNIDMAEEFLMPLTPPVRKLMEGYWPGGLTIVYPCRVDRVPELVRGKGANLGVRMPQNLRLLNCIQQIGVPILAPSANFHGNQTPYEEKDLDPELVAQVDYVLSGFCLTKQASTVVDCSVSPWKILREGAVKII